MEKTQLSPNTVQIRNCAFEAEGLAVARTRVELDRAMARLREAGGRVALVPTMGALHEGHLALISKAQEIAERTVVSIYVNPQQFAAHEDLDTYPREELSDAKALKVAGIDLVWAPSNETMYGADFATWVLPEGAAKGLESDFRPHFFQGVATVVLKLFNQVSPDVAVFGEKDYQQLCVIRQLVRDLDLITEIAGVPTVREPDGLALSSRNNYLSTAERVIAPRFNGVLCEVAQALAEGHESEAMSKKAKKELLAAGFEKIDYIEARDAETLAPFDIDSGRPGRVLAAVWLGGTRLIDNVAI